MMMVNMPLPLTIDLAYLLHRDVTRMDVGVTHMGKLNFARTIPADIELLGLSD